LSLAKLALGRRGERLAARFLRRRGYRILNRNWRCPAGEIDLVCAEGDTLVFVEVKSRSDGDFLPPEAGVGRRKRLKLERLANYYMATKGIEGLDWRVDAVSVTLLPGSRSYFKLFRGVL
jgi:putative endonuclease